MNARDASAAAKDGEDTSYDDLLSADETYEGSKHFSLDIDVDFEADVDTASMNKTVVMSPALLAQLRREILDPTGGERIHTRPTLRSMQAVRPGANESAPDSHEMCSTSPSTSHAPLRPTRLC